MSRDVSVIGAYATEFRKWPDRSFKDLTREVCLGAIADAGLADGLAVDAVWFANAGMSVWGQTSIRGQVCLAPLVNDGTLSPNAGVMNVENACASGSAAAHGAWKDILSGQSDLSLAIGVEKLHLPGVPREKILDGFAAGIDNFDPASWHDAYCRLAETRGACFEPGPGRSLFVDAAAERATWHMARYGTTTRQIALACAKSHWYGARNPKAQYQFEIAVDLVLGDRVVSGPLTRPMCAGPGDGAAAVLMCSGEMLRALPTATRRRAVALRASVLSSGQRRTIGEPGATAAAAARAYRMAGVDPRRVDVAELHDCTSFAEIEQIEALGFCGAGEGGPFVEAGETGPGGRIPVNTSGGLVSKSHPVGATGLSMMFELVTQLRGEAGERQVPGARTALHHNAGGLIGLDDAVCSVMILGRQAG
jgi:acetyl-CoA acetyltransferase